MKKYIGCRMFEVEPMTRGDYNAYRGWSVPADENPLDEGYLTKDPDGHVWGSLKRKLKSIIQ